MKVNLIGMILNNAGRHCFDGAILDDNGKPLDAAHSLDYMIMEYAKVRNGGNSQTVTLSREVTNTTIPVKSSSEGKQENVLPDDVLDTESTKRLALGMAALCVRNTFLEDLHVGMGPSTKTGDYSDVKVVSPYGEIPWDGLSRLSQEEMKTLMIEVVDKIYSVLLRIGDQDFREKLGFYGQVYAYKWNEPKEGPVDEVLDAVNELRPYCNNQPE